MKVQKAGEGVKEELEKLTLLLLRKKSFNDLPKMGILATMIVDELKSPKTSGAMLKTIMEFSMGKAGVAPPPKEPPPKTISVSFSDPEESE